MIPHWSIVLVYWFWSVIFSTNFSLVRRRYVVRRRYADELSCGCPVQVSTFHTVLEPTA